MSAVFCNFKENFSEDEDVTFVTFELFRIQDSGMCVGNKMRAVWQSDLPALSRWDNDFVISGVCEFTHGCFRQIGRRGCETAGTGKPYQRYACRRRKGGNAYVAQAAFPCQLLLADFFMHKAFYPCVVYRLETACVQQVVEGS